MRTLWKDHNFWAQPFLFPAGHQSQVQTEPAENIGDGKGPHGTQSALHQVHQDNGEIYPVDVGLTEQKNHGAFRAVIFLF